jgi:hypothetical protein
LQQTPDDGAGEGREPFFLEKKSRLAGVEKSSNPGWGRVGERGVATERRERRRDRRAERRGRSSSSRSG